MTSDSRHTRHVVVKMTALACTMLDREEQYLTISSREQLLEPTAPSLCLVIRMGAGRPQQRGVMTTWISWRCQWMQIETYYGPIRWGQRRFQTETRCKAPKTYAHYLAHYFCGELLSMPLTSRSTSWNAPAPVVPNASCVERNLLPTHDPGRYCFRRSLQ